MKKAIIVYLPVTDAYRPKKRPDVVNEALEELNEHLADGWSVEHSSPLGTGNEFTGCNLVILEKTT